MIDNLMLVGAADAYESRFASESEFEAHAAAITNALVAGEDHVLPWFGPGSSWHPASTMLGECSRPAQAALFRACHLALSPRADAEAVRGALGVFIRRVACDYAENQL